jgi:4-hydroxy-tetrahydrodipicolinate synthase
VARVEREYAGGVGGPGSQLPLRIDRGVTQRRDHDVSLGHRLHDCVDRSLGTEPREGNIRLSPRAVGVELRECRIGIRPVRPSSRVTEKASEACGEDGLVEPLNRQQGREVDPHPSLDERDRQSAERVTDDNGVRLRAHRACVVELREADLVARKIRRSHLVTTLLELAPYRLEAPASVPGAVNEQEPCHDPEYPLSEVLGRVLTAMVTPFRDDGAIDFDAFQELARHLVDKGSNGLVVAGTTGESPTLTDQERLDLIRAAVESVGDRATIVAGTGTYSTTHSMHLTEEAHELGADAFLIVTPYYSKPPQRGIVAHFEAIAHVSDRPIVVYNIPSRVVVNIELDTISRLAEIETVRAVKQAHDDLGQARHIVASGLDLYAGDDNLLQSFLEIGGEGGVCVHTHVVGPRVAEQVQAAVQGDFARAREIDTELGPVYELLRIQTNPIAIKAALSLLGHRVGGHRLPLVSADAIEVEQVRSCLERLGLLVHA